MAEAADSSELHLEKLLVAVGVFMDPDTKSILVGTSGSVKVDFMVQDSVLVTVLDLVVSISVVASEREIGEDRSVENFPVFNEKQVGIKEVVGIRFVSLKIVTVSVLELLEKPVR